MKNIGIFKENFDLAHKLSKLLNIKELNVVELPLYNSVQINCLVLSAAKESQMGGQQAVIEFSRNTKADQIMIIEEKTKDYKTETHFGGKLIKISIPEKILSGSSSLLTVSLTIGISILLGSIFAVNSTHS